MNAPEMEGGSLDHLASFLLDSDPTLSDIVDDILALPSPAAAAAATANKGNRNQPPPSSLNDEEDVCTVCGECTSVHVYFGAVSCDSCRVFFSRVVKKRGQRRLKCKTGKGKCTVKPLFQISLQAGHAGFIPR